MKRPSPTEGVAKAAARFSERGAAMLELALIIPVLFVLFFASFELIRALEAKNSLAMFSRQLAHAVFTHCVELDVGGAQNWIQQCAQSEANSIAGSNSANNILPNMSIVVSIYESDGTNVVSRGRVSMIASTSPAYSSRYDANNGNGPGVTTALINRLGKVVIAETAYRFQPIIYVPLTMGLADVTIY